MSVPGMSRVLVRVRDMHRCVVCHMAGQDWHHRRTRSVRDEHTHCPCNGITLCGPGNNHGDHGWVHSHPFESRHRGLIISRHEQRMPFEVPMWVGGKWVYLDCEGGVTVDLSGLPEPIV